MITSLILIFILITVLLVLSIFFGGSGRGGEFLIDNAVLIRILRNADGIKTIDNVALIQIMREERGGFLQ